MNKDRTVVRHNKTGSYYFIDRNRFSDYLSDGKCVVTTFSDIISFDDPTDYCFYASDLTWTGCFPEGVFHASGVPLLDYMREGLGGKL